MFLILRYLLLGLSLLALLNTSEPLLVQASGRANLGHISRPASLSRVLLRRGGAEIRTIGQPGSLGAAAMGGMPPTTSDNGIVSEVEGGREGGLGADTARVPDAGSLLVLARKMYWREFGGVDSSGDSSVSRDPQHQFSAGYAPGRVNLMGEHTDYNGGFVLPLAIERGTVVYGMGHLTRQGAADGERRGLCRVISESLSEDRAGGGAKGEGSKEAVCFYAEEGLVPGEPEWANYIKGVVKEYLPEIPEGMCLEFDACVVGTVPIGGGVSSSASLSVATATFLEGVLAASGVPLPRSKVKAHRCRMAEHKFLFTPCGIMDQFITSMAEPGHAMLLDCKSEQQDPVPLTDPDLVVVITNSNVKHNLSSSQYPVRVKQCEEAVSALQERHPGVELLRDASLAQVEEIKGVVDETIYRRARHVVSENDRTLEVARALGEGDYGRVGEHMLQCHTSLQEDYEVSCPELDTLVELAMEVEGVYGSKLTGAGFGGCTVTLAKKGSVSALIKHLEEGYLSRTGGKCSSFVTKAGHGARGLEGAAAEAAMDWSSARLPEMP